MSHPEYSEGTSNSVMCPKLVYFPNFVFLSWMKKENLGWTLQPVGPALLLPPSCQSVTSSANSSLSAKSTARASQILLLPFPSSSSHPPLHYLFVESENGIIMSWGLLCGFSLGRPVIFWHTPSGVSSQWVPSPGGCHLSGSWMPNPNSFPAPCPPIGCFCWHLGWVLSALTHPLYVSCLWRERSRRHFGWRHTWPFGLPSHNTVLKTLCWDEWKGRGK